MVKEEVEIITLDKMALLKAIEIINENNEFIEEPLTYSEVKLFVEEVWSDSDGVLTPVLFKGMIIYPMKVNGNLIAQVFVSPVFGEDIDVDTLQVKFNVDSTIH